MQLPKFLTNRRWPFLWLGFGVIAFLLVLRAADPYPVTAMRLAYFDYLQRLAPREFREDLPVRVLDIDEESLAQYGQWPWPRTEIARITDRLFELGAAAVAFDVLFAEPDRYSPSRLTSNPAFANVLAAVPDSLLVDNDTVFANSISGRPVVLGVAVRTDSAGIQPKPKAGVVQIGERPADALVQVPALTSLAPPLGDVATGIAGINVAPGAGGGTVRQVPLLWRGPTGLIPALGIEALRVAAGETTLFLEERPGAPGIVGSLGIGPWTIPTTEDGGIWLFYRKDDPRLYVSAQEIFTGEEASLRQSFSNRIVLVGTSAAGLLDLRETALGETVPGVSIHAQIIEQIMLGNVLRRSDITSGLEMLTIIALGLAVAAALRFFGAAVSIFIGGVLASVVLGISWVAFTKNGLLFDASFPLVGGIVNFSVLTAYQFIVADREKRMIRSAFSHYVAPEFLRELEKSGHDMGLGGETTQLTVMFADIRNFTPMSEKMEPTEVVSLLNDLFSRLGEEILAEKGTIDKFIGDAVMAFWNAPLKVEDHAMRAINAALRMRSALEDFNANSEALGRQPVALAIGCATGEACVGNIGSRVRFNYTAIGDVVNVTARIETSCRRVGYDIVISERLYAQADKGLALLEAGAVNLKGKSQRERIYIVVGNAELAQSVEFTELAALHDRLLMALRSGDAQKVGNTLEACLQLAPRIEPGLLAFYAAISDRREDFDAVSGTIKQLRSEPHNGSRAFI